MEEPAIWTVGSTFVNQDMDSKKIHEFEYIARNGLLVTSKSKDGCITVRDYANPFSQNVKWENCNIDGTNVITRLDDNPIWPLKIGNNWSYGEKGENVNGETWETVRECEVEKQVKVTTQLGNFDTFKVVCSDKWTVRTWYAAPEYKQSVLYTIFRKSRNTTRTYETVSFTVN
tara:strand:+ start:519 stop:1037 length:519 start_codon:yes stop_codon:yes gene_type:complete